MGSVPCCTQSIHIYRMCVCVQKKTCLILVAVFGQGNNLNGRLSQKWIDANGSLLQSQMPQARADRQPTSLSPSLSVFLSMCGTKWSAILSKTPRCRAAAGIHLSVLGLSRILSLLLAGSKSNKKRGQMRARKEKGNKREQSEKTVELLLPASSVRWTDTLNECKRSLEWKIQKVITYEISAAVTSFQHSACNPHPLQNTYARAHTHTHWIHLHFLSPPESSNSDYLLAFNFVTTSDNPLILPSKLPYLQIGSLSAEPLSLITSMVSFPAVTVLMHKARFTWCILIWIPLLMASEDAMPQFVHYRLWKKCFIKYLLQMWFFFFFRFVTRLPPFPCYAVVLPSWVDADGFEDSKLCPLP